MNNWSQENVLKFINHYKKLPCLWDTSVTVVSHPMKNEAYKILHKFVAKNIDKTATIETVKKKIKYLRRAFLREYRKRNEENKQNRNYKPKLFYFNELMFIVEQPNTGLNYVDFLQATTSSDQPNITSLETNVIRESTNSSRSPLVETLPQSPKITLWGENEDLQTSHFTSPSISKIRCNKEDRQEAAKYVSDSVEKKQITQKLRSSIQQSLPINALLNRTQEEEDPAKLNNPIKKATIRPVRPENFGTIANSKDKQRTSYSPASKANETIKGNDVILFSSSSSRSDNSSQHNKRLKQIHRSEEEHTCHKETKLEKGDNTIKEFGLSVTKDLRKLKKDQQFIACQLITKVITKGEHGKLSSRTQIVDNDN